MSETRVTPNVHDVACRHCGSGPGFRCRTALGKPTKTCHSNRIVALDGIKPHGMTYEEWDLLTSLKARETD